MEFPLVSFVIPMYNAEKTIYLCLKSITELNYPKDRFEIIVVDNNSTDNSPAIARSSIATLYNKKNGTIAAVRNFGAKHARGDILAFVDSDCMILENWVTAALEQLKLPENGATGNRYSAPPESTWVERAWLYDSNGAPYETDFIPGGNFIIKAAIFKQLGGFNETLITCEDVDICHRVKQCGLKVINCPAMKNIHFGNHKTLKQFFLKEIWYGTNMMQKYSTNKVSNVFFVTSIFTILHTAFFVSIMTCNLIGNCFINIITPVTGLFFIVAVSAAYRVKKSKKYRLLPHIFILCYVYFLARSISLIKNIRLRGCA
ncbi:MAG: hypothetical protein COX17_05720 [Deltaproteobacteria bacterium CG23_combo_of_CG06-09_8_20_14_all_60_8]|nr:MAG: hypothetical protein COX17_05720 [Deltaproteobacteria bacterium CG23_combo_of_CG06-09_8_20_14_all_60_8]